MTRASRRAEDRSDKDADRYGRSIEREASGCGADHPVQASRGSRKLG